MAGHITIVQSYYCNFRKNVVETLSFLYAHNSFFVGHHPLTNQPHMKSLAEGCQRFCLPGV